jgi:hypothetical protein
MASSFGRFVPTREIEAGKLELNPQTVVLAPLIEEVVGTARQLAEQNKNRLLVEAQENLGTLTVDPMRLRQILLNLLSNALPNYLCDITDGAPPDSSFVSSGNPAKALIENHDARPHRDIQILVGNYGSLLVDENLPEHHSFCERDTRHRFQTTHNRSCRWGSGTWQYGLSSN